MQCFPRKIDFAPEFQNSFSKQDADAPVFIVTKSGKIWGEYLETDPVIIR